METTIHNFPSFLKWLKWRHNCYAHLFAWSGYLRKAMSWSSVFLGKLYKVPQVLQRRFHGLKQPPILFYQGFAEPEAFEDPFTCICIVAWSISSKHMNFIEFNKHYHSMHLHCFSTIYFLKKCSRFQCFFRCISFQTKQTTGGRWFPCLWDEPTEINVLNTEPLTPPAVQLEALPTLISLVLQVAFFLPNSPKVFPPLERKRMADICTRRIN